jgi:hypothetical protein
MSLIKRAIARQNFRLGACPALLPILERFATDTQLRSERFPGYSVPNPVQAKMLRKQFSVSAQRVRIPPYGPDHELAKRVRNGPLPPGFT